jgi:hypothetical protein
MKGLLLSAMVFVCYVVFTAILAHLLRVERHSRLFVPAAGLGGLAYAVAFLLLPAGLGFLPERWQAHLPWLDFLAGGVILVLNIHNYVDWFFGFNGGFSTSLMLLLYRAGGKGAGTEELIARYHGKDGIDKIYGWRVPRLEETGYIVISKDGVCTLTEKGKRIARISAAIKKILNLGAGG